MLKRGSSSQVIAIFVELPSKTDCKKSASTSTASTGRFPTDLSCVVKYEEVSPDFNKQPTRHGQNGNNFWAPPNIKGAYRRDKARAKLFRWMGGRVEEIDSSSLGTLIPYKAATVFTQYPDTHHLLAVDFDAETKDVADEPGGWKVLSFNHRPLPGAQETYYSSIALFGAEQQLAAPGSTQWVPQLLPKIYDYDSSGSATSTPKSAGLI
ncbi:MAG: hypothetical protein L6R39_007297, partial [Caloplaca ligustica]